MAERRMLHRRAAVSSDLAELRERQGADAALFFVLLIPFYDRWGCVPDDARALRAMVCPTWDDVSVEDVKRWIGHLVRRKMLVRVKGTEGDRGLRNPSFHEHQSGTHFEREAPSTFEPTDITRAWSRDQSKAKNEVRTKSGPPSEKRAEGARATSRKVGADHDEKSGDSRKVRTKSGRVGTKSAERKGREGKDLPPSPSPSPPPPDASATPPPPSPGALAGSPAEGNGRRHNDEPLHAGESARSVLERMRARQEADA